MTTVIGVDPGVRNCGITVLVNREVVHWCAFHDFEGDDVWRCHVVTRMIQILARDYDADVIGYEKYFGAGKFAAQRSQSNYVRGMLDCTVYSTLAHIPIIMIHPSWVKKWATGNGSAKKPIVVEALENRLSSEHPVFHGNVLRTYLAASTDVFESFVIGEIAHCLFNRQWQSIGTPMQKELCRHFEKKSSAIRRPRLSSSRNIPAELLVEPTE